jgi:outer membrane protein assembly factor BamB
MSILAAILLSDLATGQDWPGWRGPDRDGVVKGFTPPAEWPKELKKGLEVQVGEGISTPALVGGQLFVFARQGEEEVTLCIDATTGKEIWRDKLEMKYEPLTEAKPYGKGPFASPLVADGRVYTFGIKSVLSCLDAKTGKLLWREDFKGSFAKPEAEWGSAASPIVVDGAVIVHAGGGRGKMREGDGKGAIMALDAATGKLRWRWDGDCAAFASPILATVGGKPQLITQTESLAVGLSPSDGKALWQIEYKTAYQQNSVTPIVFENLVILSGYKMGVSAYKLEGEKPARAWQTKDASMYMSTPILKGGKLYGHSDLNSGQYFCLDAKTGEVLWTSDGRQGQHASVVEAGGFVLALNTPDPRDKKPATLVVFEAKDGDYVEKARYKAADSPAWAHPVISGKSIYVKDATKLTQWILP